MEDLYADFVADLPRFQTLSRISALRSSLRHVHDEPPQAHRQKALPVPGPPRHPTANTKIQQAVPRPYGEQEEWSARMRQCKFATMPEIAACPLYRALPDVPTFLFVHLFSGRRRTGDFHMELQNFALQKNWRVVILSLDTAVSIEYGNLLHHTVSWRALEECYLAGRIAATLCGPPCVRDQSAGLDLCAHLHSCLASMDCLHANCASATLAEISFCSVSGFWLRTLPMAASSWRNTLRPLF